VRLPDDVRARLTDAVTELRGVAPDVAWVAPDNLHLTLKFLGAVEEARLSAIGSALAAAAAGQPAFGFRCAGLGAFPSPGRPRVVWAGIEQADAALAALARAVEQSLVPLGFEQEARDFTAHVTLGRIREPRRQPALPGALAAAARREFGRVRVDHISLMQSQLHPRGARYSALAAFELDAGPPWPCEPRT
jgi:2'-5' RNA ligase